MNNPRQTPNGDAFLNNFATVKERQTASLLLDSILTVDSNVFRANLLAGLDAVESQCRKGALAAYPVIDMAPRSRSSKHPRQMDHRNRSDSASVINKFLKLAMSEQRKKVYSQYGRLTRWAPTPEELVPGKDKSIAIRTILFIDDFCGSGNQAFKYLTAWSRDPTFRSWRRAGLIDTIYLGFAATNRGAALLRTLRSIDKHVILYPDLDFEHAGWTESQLTDVRELCQAYADNPEESLGYNESEGLFCSTHTIPNNLPIILRQKKWKKATWRPAFDPQHTGTIPNQRPPQIDHGRAGVNSYGMHSNLLGAIKRGATSETKIMRSLNFTAYETRDVVEVADGSVHLTNFGHAEWGQVRSRQTSLSTVRDNPRAYYPGVDEGSR